MMPSAFGMLAQMTGAARVLWGGASITPGDIDFLRKLLASGKIRSVIDRRYPLAEIAEAHRYVEAGHKKGNVVILVA